MAEPKTKVTKASPKKFIEAIADPEVRADCKRIAAMMAKATGEKPRCEAGESGAGRRRRQEGLALRPGAISDHRENADQDAPVAVILEVERIERPVLGEVRLQS